MSELLSRLPEEDEDYYPIPSTPGSLTPVKSVNLLSSPFFSSSPPILRNIFREIEQQPQPSLVKRSREEIEEKYLGKRSNVIPPLPMDIVNEIIEEEEMGMERTIDLVNKDDVGEVIDLTNEDDDDNVKNDNVKNYGSSLYMNWQNLDLLRTLRDRKRRLGRGLEEDSDLFLAESKIPGAGRGLFTRFGIKKNQIITWYTGKIQTREEKITSHDKSHTITLVPGELAISGLKEPQIGNGAGSFVNHSDRPNAVAIRSSISEWGSTPIVLLKALSDIEPGEEIFINYGRGYWKRGNWKNLGSSSSSSGGSSSSSSSSSSSGSSSSNSSGWEEFFYFFL